MSTNDVVLTLPIIAKKNHKRVTDTFSKKIIFV